MKRLVLVMLALFAFEVQAACAPPRNQTQKRVFARANPCPTTKLPAPSCPGYLIDHVEPLCAGGKDVVANMQWQTLADSQAKDKREVNYCRCIKKNGKANCTMAAP